MNIEETVLEIRNILSERRKEFKLSFEEDSHKYTMLNLDGELTDKWPSVSKVMKLFYDEFPSEKKAFEMSGGDPDETERLLNEWKMSGEYATNMGSRVHFLLEKYSLDMFNYQKTIREPIYECDATQITKGDAMITAGKLFLEKMKERGAYLLDTEIVLGHPELGYTGQGDTGWLIENKNKTGFGFIITDYKSNKEKNFIKQWYTKPMRQPFQYLPNNALGHYNTQLPLYGKLLLKMLEGTKYENIPLLGCIVVRLTEDREYVEYRVDKSTINTILDMDIKPMLNKLKK
jgi:hypothetical protein|tara:strand:+ start:1301 stop:2167 length:867 start_codon:yes stop_codon:yes gene_type:complete